MNPGRADSGDGPRRSGEVPVPGVRQEVSASGSAQLAVLGSGVQNVYFSGPDPQPAVPVAAPVRVSEVDPRLLGVHVAISVPGVPDDVLPEYVLRDVDAAEFGVRASVAAAARRGGFVLLVGGSSVGKTRCAVEAVRALLPEWWLVHPAGPAEVTVLAQAPAGRMVVWLDELQRYLDGEQSLTGGVVRALLGASQPVVIIGTLWPDRYTAYTATPASGGPDPRAREREVLELATVVRIDPEFSAAEQDRARVCATRDARLRIGLDAAGYGLTQTLAAAPQLVGRWQDARSASPYAWAVLTAALDAARLGARAPLSADLLRDAAPGYCTSQQQAEASENWLEQALAYATGKLHGAAAALSPAGAGMGQVAGYIVADYLLQHASGERRYARAPASLWDAVLSHLRDSDDTTRLADSARHRLLYRYAIPLYRHAADSGDGEAAGRLAELLEKRGDLDGAEQVLRAWADAGDGEAAGRLAGLLADRGDLDGLRARADAGDGEAAVWLAGLLAEHGDLDEAEQVLRALADVGDADAARRLANLLQERGDMDGVEQVLRAQADAGDVDSARRLAWLLESYGDFDEAEQVLRPRADAGDGDAAVSLAWLLRKLGDFDEAEQVLRPRADAGDWQAAELLAEILEKRGDLDGLRARADAGDGKAAELLAEILEKRGDLDGAEQVLRPRADAGDGKAAERLNELLLRRGDLDGLGARADDGDPDAARSLAAWLAGLGDLDGLWARANAGDRYAAGWLSSLLQRRGDLDGLRALADAGDGKAAERLANLLEERGDLGGVEQVLRARADADDGNAARRLARLLEKRGDLGGAEQVLRARADAGDWQAAELLAELLVKRRDLDGLNARIDAADEYAAERLTDLLINLGRGGEAEQLRRFGFDLDGSIASA
jgi:thioredoxin-like negative regulator of GroEL